MSLYLCIFDGDQEVCGWVFGHYSDFAAFREAVARGRVAKNCPIFLEHSDCDGLWSLTDLPQLRRELCAMADDLRSRPPEPLINSFEHTATDRAGAANLLDCFHNAEGTNVVAALVALCELGIRLRQPILFQ